MPTSLEIALTPEELLKVISGDKIKAQVKLGKAATPVEIVLADAKESNKESEVKAWEQIADAASGKAEELDPIDSDDDIHDDGDGDDIDDEDDSDDIDDDDDDESDDDDDLGDADDEEDSIDY